MEEEDDEEGQQQGGEAARESGHDGEEREGDEHRRETAEAEVEVGACEIGDVAVSDDGHRRAREWSDERMAPMIRRAEAADWRLRSGTGRCPALWSWPGPVSLNTP